MEKMKHTKTFWSWAIEGNIHQRPFLYGRYWWWEKRPPIVPPQFEGLEYCLFKTRKVARKYKRLDRDGIVRRVKVTVEW
jgi:hypothetical protein